GGAKLLLVLTSPAGARGADVSAYLDRHRWLGTRGKSGHPRIAAGEVVGAKVTALTVEAPFNIYDVPESRIRHISEAFVQHAEHAKQHAAGVLRHVTELAKAADVPCETLQVEHDHPYQAIVTTAKDKGCDLIVVASHGRSGISAILLGSVTNKVL